MNWGELADSADRRKKERIRAWRQHGVMLAKGKHDLTYIICCLFSCTLLKE